MTTRRDALLVLPALSAASLARAQAPKSAKPKRIGDLNSGPGPERSDPDKPIIGEERFWGELRKSGWVLGENVVAERAFAHGRLDRLASLAEELVRKRVDVVLTDGEEASVAAARATRDIPILFTTGVVWPVELGLIDSLARPGRNVTGFTDHAGADTVNKRLEFLQAIAPSAKRLSWLWGAPTTALQTVAGGQFDPVPSLASAASALGFETRFHVVRAPEQIADVFAEIVSWRAQAITAGGQTVVLARQRLGELALRHRLPIAAIHRGYLASGALLCYGPSREDWAARMDRSFVYLDRILRGGRPAELPVVQPSRYELVINMKTADTLGLTVPSSVLQRADELIR
jgi:ABC-type uncharacterized transport system substrate-binding protein